MTMLAGNYLLGNINIKLRQLFLSFLLLFLDLYARSSFALFSLKAIFVAVKIISNKYTIICLTIKK